MLQTDGWDFTPAEQLAGHQSAGARDYLEICIDQNRNIEAKRFNAACDLPDLSGGMQARIVRVEIQLDNWPINHRNPPSGLIDAHAAGIAPSINCSHMEGISRKRVDRLISCPC